MRIVISERVQIAHCEQACQDLSHLQADLLLRV